MKKTKEELELFDNLKSSLMNIDPVSFAEKYLTLDGKPFRVNNNGFRPFADIYRYIGIKALEPNAKPVILVKGRQVGGTTMAGVTEMYFMGSGLFGTENNPPIRVIHAFPHLEAAAAYSKTKLNPLISSSILLPNVDKKTKVISYMQSLLDPGSSSNDSLHFKQFAGGNHIWIESTGLDADRLRGRTADAIFFDECFPYEQCIETEYGKLQIGKLYEDYIVGKNIPLIKSFNEEKQLFEYKKINNAWCRGKKKILEICCGNEKIKCTPNHKFLTIDGWKQANDLKLGSLIKTSINTTLHSKLLNNYNYSYNEYGFMIVDYINLIEKKEIVYDIEVEDNHNFILASNRYKENIGGPIVHNCQDIPENAIGNALKMLTTAKYGKVGKGVQVYFGTPKRKGSGFFKMWNLSSQQYYHLGCENCKEYFPLYTPGSNEWENIWIRDFIVKCTHCGHEQDKRDAAERGKWVATKDFNDENCLFVGFHINQLYMPRFTKQDILNEKPGIHPVNTERIYQNEVLGEFFQGDASPITQEEIIEKCGDIGRKFRAKISPGEETIVALGLDYGAKSDLEQLADPDRYKNIGQSYSTAVILVAKGNLLSIEYCLKFKRNDIESKKGIIEQLIRQYSVNIAVGDIGYSNDLSGALYLIHGDKYIVSRAHAKVNAANRIKFNKEALPKEILFEKDFYYSEMFEQFKSGKIRFPLGAYEQVMWLIQHCSSMELKPIISRVGDPSIHYVKGGSANNGFTDWLMLI